MAWPTSWAAVELSTSLVTGAVPLGFDFVAWCFFTPRVPSLRLIGTDGSSLWVAPPRPSASREWSTTTRWAALGSSTTSSRRAVLNVVWLPLGQAAVIEPLPDSTDWTSPAIWALYWASTAGARFRHEAGSSWAGSPGSK